MYRLSLIALNTTGTNRMPTSTHQRRNPPAHAPLTLVARRKLWIAGVQQWRTISICTLVACVCGMRVPRVDVCRPPERGGDFRRRGHSRMPCCAQTNSLDLCHCHAQGGGYSFQRQCRRCRCSSMIDQGHPDGIAQHLPAGGLGVPGTCAPAHRHRARQALVAHCVIGGSSLLATYVT